MKEKALLTPPVSGSSRINMGYTERFLSAAGGALLLVKTTRGKLGISSLINTLTGVYLLYRGTSGHCPVKQAIAYDSAQRESRALEIRESMTINRPRREVYQEWRKLENLPRFMKHLERVSNTDGKRSHWEARIPGGLGTIQWDAEVIREDEGELLVWRSLKDAVVDNAGEVFFRDAPGGRGTEIEATITYRPPAGDIGHAVAGMLNSRFERMIREDLRNFKRIMETGEMATIENQPAGR